MVTNQRRAAFLVRIGCLTLGGLLALGGACSSGDGGGSGKGGGTAGTSGGTAGGGGQTGTAGTGGGGTTGTGGGGTTGTGGGAAGTGGGAGGAGVGGSGGGAGGVTGAGGGAGSAGTAGASGTTGTGGGAGGRGGAAGGAGRGGSGGGAGGGGTGGGSGGATSCAGHAVSFNANGPGRGDAAMARVNVAFAASADLPTANANRTIEFWAYMLTNSWAQDANTTFFYGTNNRVADGFGLDFGANMGTQGTIDPFTNAIFDNDNQPSGVQTSPAQWVHFAMTWDGTAVRGFVNGVEKATKNAPATGQRTLMTGVTALTIGGYSPDFFNGQIDEFRIWNVAHTAAQITGTMHTTLMGNEAGLTGYWKFDETSGTTAADSVTSAGHTAHPATLMANTTANLPTWVVSTAPINCP